MHKSYIFGIGLILDLEFQLSEEIIIRPTKIDIDHISLQDYATNKRDYGFIVALAEEITFELMVSGKDEKSVAINAWNHQWILILLSIVLKSPIYHPISSTSSSKNLKHNCCYLKNVYIAPPIFNQRVKCEEIHLHEVKDTYDDFKKLLSEKSFAHAASVAAHNFNEPKKSIRMAAIWSGIEALLNIESELNYRIPLLCAILLGKSENNKLDIFSKTQKLYKARSKCVHGSNVEDKEIDKDIDESLTLLSDLIKLFCRNKKIPDKNELKKLPLMS